MALAKGEPAGWTFGVPIASALGEVPGGGVNKEVRLERAGLEAGLPIVAAARTVASRPDGRPLAMRCGRRGVRLRANWRLLAMPRPITPAPIPVLLLLQLPRRPSPVPFSCGRGSQGPMKLPFSTTETAYCLRQVAACR